MTKIKDATELRVGDRIVTNRRGDVEQVVALSTRGSHNTATVHTDSRDITTGLPCPVKVED